MPRLHQRPRVVLGKIEITGLEIRIAAGHGQWRAIGIEEGDKEDIPTLDQILPDPVQLRRVSRAEGRLGGQRQDVGQLPRLFAHVIRQFAPGSAR